MLAMSTTHSERIRCRERSFLLDWSTHRRYPAYRPNWFAAVMGTGIVANAAALLRAWPRLKELAIAPLGARRRAARR